MCIVIQEVFPDGVVEKDGRLLPGDQVLEVNGLDLSTATHSEAKRGLSQIYPICRLTVYRERAEEHCPIEKEGWCTPKKIYLIEVYYFRSLFLL